MYTEGTKRLSIAFQDPEGKEIAELINYYRVLSKMGWNQFLLEALSLYIGQENDMVSGAIDGYLTRLPNKPRTGRPSGAKQPDHIKSEHSKRMKKNWEVRKAFAERAAATKEVGDEEK